MLGLADWAWLTTALAAPSGEATPELPGMEVDSAIASMMREAVSGSAPAQAWGGGGQQRAGVPGRQCGAPGGCCAVGSAQRHAGPTSPAGRLPATLSDTHCTKLALPALAGKAALQHWQPTSSPPVMMRSPNTEAATSCTMLRVPESRSAASRSCAGGMAAQRAVGGTGGSECAACTQGAGGRLVVTDHANRQA